MTTRSCVLAAMIAAGVSLAPPVAAQVSDSDVYLFTLFELLEHRGVPDDGQVHWDFVGWLGGDVNRVWAKSESTIATTESSGDTELQLLYGRLISPFWDFQVGARGEMLYGGDDLRGRGFATIGIQGLAPGFFEVEAALFVSHLGDVSGRFSVAYDFLLTQRLVLELRTEFDVAVQKVEEFGVGSGPTELELGVRARYEVRREIAPYIGVVWTTKFFDTASMARASGDDVSRLLVVAGLRLWR